MRHVVPCLAAVLLLAATAAADVALLERRSLQRSIEKKTSDGKVKRDAADARAIGSQALIDADGLEFFFNTDVTSSSLLTYTSTYVTYTYSGTYTYTYTYSGTYTHTYSGTYSYTYPYTFTYTFPYTYTFAYTTYSSPYTYTFTYSFPYTYTFTYSHTYTYTEPWTYSTTYSATWTDTLPVGWTTTYGTWTTASTTWSASASGAASDASFTTGATTTLSDAFDGYVGLWVNGSLYNDNGPATTDCNGRQLLLNPQTIGDLQVSRRVYQPDDDEFARWLNIITNTGGSPVSVSVELVGNLGSDEDTLILGSSDSDQTAETTDLWVATGGDPNDPRLGHVYQGVGSTTSPSSVDIADSDDWVYWDYQLNVGAGETVIVMHLVTGQPTDGDAQAKAAELAAMPAAIGECMTAVERSQVVNFPSLVPVELQRFRVD